MSWSNRAGLVVVPLAALALAAACSDSETTASSTSSVTTGMGGVPNGPTTTSTMTTNGGNGGDGGDGASGGSTGECANATAVPGERSFTIDFDGNEREYDVQIPLSYDGSSAVPMVFDLHGYTSTKGAQKLISGFSELAEQEGFIVVRPNGFGALRSWNAGDFCCGLAQDQDLDDVGLMRAIVDEVSAIACVDPRRIYATGLSNGGAMSHRLACEAADVFAAVAPVSYPLDLDPFTDCQPSRAIAVMHSHGRSDTIVPYDGSAFQPSTPASFAYWGMTNTCAGDPVETYRNNTSWCDTYETCDGGVQTALCTVNGGHELYSNFDGVPIAELSWQFLSAHTLP